VSTGIRVGSDLISRLLLAEFGDEWMTELSHGVIGSALRMALTSQTSLDAVEKREINWPYHA
jgi:hypothetical protein